LSTALFAERALLVEGPTEAAVLYGIADRSTVGHLEANGVAIVWDGGKSGIPLAHAILSALGIPAYALFDGDNGFEARARAMGKDEARIASERGSHISTNRRLLRYFGLPEEDFPGTQTSERVAILEDHLETLLRSDWPEWGAACERLAQATG